MYVIIRDSPLFRMIGFKKHDWFLRNTFKDICKNKVTQIIKKVDEEKKLWKVYSSHPPRISTIEITNFE